MGDQAKPSHREILRQAIDNAMAQKPTSLEALIQLLQQANFEVNVRGKTVTLRISEWKKAARIDSLGDGYTLNDLDAVLSGQKEYVSRKETPKVNLLVDIQAKLQTGKGAGYAQWAKVFNLKQMAQTMNYLAEHKLLEYTALEEKAAVAAAEYHALADQIKKTEKRLSEISALKTHIINYAKTREIYIAYRKAGYAKKFLAQHESDILLHKAAKKAFDEMGIQKLPTVKSLQDEYAKTLQEKKKTYAAYRHAREEMRELLTVKANIDRLIKLEKPDAEKGKDHDQR